ncbi:winged helix-turn-helix domain-containing protein [uncultured Rubinisphaera sp.]|uniref:winged helix-turn-helix domain-containing protein n=1 Tax=uncultured Rubinisphaera sp. TaxID=1678686 RepID=UPI0030DAA571
MANKTKTTGAAQASTKRATRKNALGGELKAATKNTPTRKPKASTTKPITESSKTETKNETTTTKKATSKPTGKLSLLDAAVQILTNASEPMTCKAIVEQAGEQKLWSSPNGKTPHNTLYAAILREIKLKGNDSRFTKMDRGLFAISAKN